MKRRITLALAAAVLVTAIPTATEAAKPAHRFGRYDFQVSGNTQQLNVRGRVARRQAQNYTWHGPYLHNEYGRPLALVVPPTAEYQMHYSWGVGGTRVSRIDHQFTRPFPGINARGGRFMATPAWPSSTDQRGVYYVRGPW